MQQYWLQFLSGLGLLAALTATAAVGSTEELSCSKPDKWELKAYGFFKPESGWRITPEGLSATIAQEDRSSFYGWKFAVAKDAIPVDADHFYLATIEVKGAGNVRIDFLPYAKDGSLIGSEPQALDTPIEAVGTAPDAAGWRKLERRDIVLPPGTVSVRPTLAMLGCDAETVALTVKDLVWQQMPDRIRSRPEVQAVPALTDRGFLPEDRNLPAVPDGVLRFTAARGEYESGSFVVAAADTAPLKSVTARAAVLTGPDGAVITPDALDLRLVKCWYTAGTYSTYVGTSRQVLRPELLLHDEKMIKVNRVEQANYVRLSFPDGDRYACVSNRYDEVFATPGGETRPLPNAVFPVRDAAELRPVDIAAGTLQQFFVTLHVPDNAVPGRYRGTISIQAEGEAPGEIQVELTVLPFELPKPYTTSSIYYKGQLGGDGCIGAANYADSKSETQFRAEMVNLLEHGVDNPSIFLWWNKPENVDRSLAKVLAIRREVGMDNSELFLWGGSTGASDKPEDLAKLRASVKQVLAIAGQFGAKKVYFYGIDEASGDLLKAERTAWQAVHDEGGFVYVAGMCDQPGLAADILDIGVRAGPLTDEAEMWHSHGHRVFSYANPQTGVELPTTYRCNYGLRLWQHDYNGAMDHAYQAGYGHPYNDFDSIFRDEIMAYPTVDGVVDTVEWEGYREGIDDLRYLTLLQKRIADALRSGDSRREEAAHQAEAFLAGLKKADLETADLDHVRQEIVKQILTL